MTEKTEEKIELKDVGSAKSVIADLIKEAKIKIASQAPPVDKVAASKALAEKLEIEANVKKGAATKKRDVVAIQTKPVESQTAYERRGYMRDHFHNAPETEVRHATSDTLSGIVDKFVMYVATTKKTHFQTGDLINAFQTVGPSRGDVNRSAMRHLKSVKAVSIHNIGTKKHPRYTYDVNTTSKLFAPIFEAPPVVEASTEVLPKP